MSLTSAEIISIKQLLFDELTAADAGNIIKFKLINLVDTSEDLETLISTVRAATALLVDSELADELSEKIRDSVKRTAP